MEGYRSRMTAKTTETEQNDETVECNQIQPRVTKFGNRRRNATVQFYFLGEFGVHQRCSRENCFAVKQFSNRSHHHTAALTTSNQREPLVSLPLHHYYRCRRRLNRCPCGECCVRMGFGTPGKCSFHARAAAAVDASKRGAEALPQRALEREGRPGGVMGRSAAQKLLLVVAGATYISVNGNHHYHPPPWARAPP